MSFVVFSLLVTQAVYAQTSSANKTRSEAGSDALKFLDSTAKKAGLTSRDPGEEDFAESQVLGIVGNIINVVLGFVGIIFFILLFWAGIRWMTSGGNEEIVKEAKQTIKTSVIGIAIVFSAFLITNFTLNQLGVISKQSGSTTDTYGLCTYFIDTGSGCLLTNPSLDSACSLERECNFSFIGKDISGACGDRDYVWIPDSDCE